MRRAPERKQVGASNRGAEQAENQARKSFNGVFRHGLRRDPKVVPPESCRRGESEGCNGAKNGGGSRERRLFEIGETISVLRFMSLRGVANVFLNFQFMLYCFDKKRFLL